MKAFFQKLFDWLCRAFDSEVDHMRDNSRVKKMLKRHEGLRLAMYKCSADKWTIAYGRNLEDRGVYQDEAELMLDNDIKRAIEDAERFSWFKELNHARQDVIIDMLFNLGLNRFVGFRKTIVAIEKRDFEKASIEMLDSLWAKQVGVRAMRLSQMMATGKHLDEDLG